MSPNISNKPSRRTVTIIVLLLAAAGAAIYFYFDPSGNILFPKCPFKMATGWDCPGCGSQRAIHHLLHGEIGSAWRMNPLLILLIPYLLLGLIAELFRTRYAWAAWLRKYLFGSVAGFILLGVIVLYTVLRNVL